MKNQPPDFSQFVRIANPRLGQDTTLCAPVLSIAFYLRLIDYAGVRQLYDEVMKLMQPELTHYHAESMKRPAKLAPRALDMVPTWMSKPKRSHKYWWTANAGNDLGCSPPGCEFLILAEPVADAERKRKLIEAAIQNYLGPGDINGYVLGSSVRVMLPVDHALGEAGALAKWLTSLDLLRRGNFDSVEASYGLCCLPDLEKETELLERASCSRYPGLDSFRSWHAGQVRSDPNAPDLIPLIKRAAWTHVLHEATLDALGGEEKLREQFADTPEIRLTRFEHGLIIQAGERPELGDLNRGELLPLLRKVSTVLRPVRALKLATDAAEENPFWGHFFEIFDKDYN